MGLNYLDYTYELRELEEVLDDKVLYSRVVSLFDNEDITAVDVMEVMLEVVTQLSSETKNYLDAFDEGYEQGYKKGVHEGCDCECEF